MDNINNVDLGEIVYCNITCKFMHYKKLKIHTFEKVVWKNRGEYTFFKKRLFDAYKVKEPLPILKLEVIKRMGYSNIL